MMMVRIPLSLALFSAADYLTMPWANLPAVYRSALVF